MPPPWEGGQRAATIAPSPIFSLRQLLPVFHPPRCRPPPCQKKKKKNEKCMVLAQGEGRVFWGFYRPACNITAGAAWISTFLTPPDQPFPLHCLLLPSVSCPPPTAQHPGGLAPLVAQGVKGWYPACEGSVRGQSSGLTCRLDGGPPQSELSVLPPSHPLCPELLCTLSLPPLVCVGVPFQFVCHAGPVCSYERTGVTQSVRHGGGLCPLRGQSRAQAARCLN